MNKELIYWIWLSQRLGVANEEFVTIYEYYENVFEIYRAEEDEFVKAVGISPQTASRLADKNIEDAGKILYYCSKHFIKIMVYSDPQYPDRLKNIKNPPVLLYYLGDFPAVDDKLAVSIVGTRKMSEYGKQAAYKIAYELAGAGAVVISGMALGIDGVASCGALEGGGEVIAVLGSGIDVVYPKEHRRLMEIIKSHGAVITEYAPCTPPDGKNFPIRNRIISGISGATLVIEGDMHSGSLITARTAVTQGRELYAIPGNLNEENAEGTNALLKAGATMVIDSEDIVKNYRQLHPEMVNEVAYSKSKIIKSDCDAALEKMKICARIYGRNYGRSRKGTSSEQLLEAQKKSLVATSTVKNNVGAVKQPTRRVPYVSSTSENTVKPDNSMQALSSLKESHRKIFDAIPLNEYTTADNLAKLSGYSISDVLVAVTMLELKGLIDIHPGGQYGRK